MSPDELAEKHVGLAHEIARKAWFRTGCKADYDDMVGDALLGLVKASRSFSPERGVRFTTFAGRRIAGSIYDGLRDLMGISRACSARLRELRMAEPAITAQLGRSPESEDFAQHLGMSLDEYNEVRLKLNCGMLPLEDFEADSHEFLDSESESPFDHACRGERIARLNAAIDDLSDMERVVLHLYIVEEMTMEQIGFVVDRCESRISQVIKTAAAKLKQKLAVPQKQTIQ